MPLLNLDEVDTVVFDIGNVLLDFDPGAMLSKLFPDAPETRDRLLECVFHSPVWLMLDRGIITEQEALRKVTAEQPDLEEDVRYLLDRWPALMRPRPEAQLTFRCLHEQGKRILLLTNYQSRAFRIALECFSFLRQAAGWLVSADVHMLKPDPAIFRETIRRFDLNPARTLFLDDSVPNVETALYLGFQALVVRREGDLTRFFLSD